ncbi:uncharacterized protein LOC121422129 [Lytechinus variegatus]|uniref:uncharacterized protein LOC121422129 n=1 Tax=Lytechinus variegatus TaxID=7654 RepID=UPI001BB147E6|nr:uncharacterized protein LOC121422129 [Lytechinus variegatus]
MASIVTAFKLLGIIATMVGARPYKRDVASGYDAEEYGILDAIVDICEERASDTNRGRATSVDQFLDAVCLAFTGSLEASGDGSGEGSGDGSGDGLEEWIYDFGPIVEIFTPDWASQQLLSAFAERACRAAEDIGYVDHVDLESFCRNNRRPIDGGDADEEDGSGDTGSGSGEGDDIDNEDDDDDGDNQAFVWSSDWLQNDVFYFANDAQY